MKSNELRVGNWVKCYNLVFQLDCIDGCAGYIQGFKGTQGEFRLSDCEPIPLTPEILEKAGFEKYNYYPDVECYIYYNKYFISMGEDIWLHQIVSNNSAVVLNNNMQYLHQLQNLYFALTGEELNIKF